MKHVSYTDNSDQFSKLLAFIEPLQWNYQEGIIGDDWFLDFIDGELGPYNEELYYKYINRILSYPLDADRLQQKIYHGYRLLNTWGNLTESIQVFEEVLLEDKSELLENIK